MAGRITFAGHATVLIEVAGTRLLTDPLLRNRFAHLRRRSAPVAPEVARGLHGVLISHLHHDHFDTASLGRISSVVPIVMPRGGGQLARRAGFSDVREVVAGDEIELGGVRVQVVPALHDDRRGPGPAGPPIKAAPVGFVVDGGPRVYFAGDTDVFDEMAAIDPLDVALLPIWGWGPTLGPGHMDPLGAARALTLLRARIAIPIHWGTFYPVALHRVRPRPLEVPPHVFAHHAARLAPDVDVRILPPGDSLEL